MSKKGAKDKSGDSTSYSTDDIVLAKIRGYPPWPAVVIDPETVPPNVLKERPSSSKTKFYCVRFFPAGDYSWSISKDMSLLQKHEMEAYINEPHKKSGDLLEGYKVALDPEKWYKKKEEELKKSQAKEAEMEIDQLDEENDGPPTKKRKKPEGETKTKPKKAAANGTSEKKKKAPTSKKSGAKTADGIESEDEAGGGKPAKKKAKKADDEENDPEVKKVKEWRHALQRVFLNKSPAKDVDMAKHDELLKQVESYEELNLKQLQHSKIGKVMRHIAALTPDKVPRDDEFKFRDRANALVVKWQKLISPEDASKLDIDAMGDLSIAPNGDA